jgi:hypothetical protein
MPGQRNRCVFRAIILGAFIPMSPSAAQQPRCRALEHGVERRSAGPLGLDTHRVAVPGIFIDRSATASHAAALVFSWRERVTWMATECIPATAQTAEPPTSRTTRRLPRRARGFYYLTEADVRAIVMRVGFSPEARAKIIPTGRATLRSSSAPTRTGTSRPCRRSPAPALHKKSG